MRMRRLALGSYDEEKSADQPRDRARHLGHGHYHNVRDGETWRGMKTTSMPGMSPALRQAFRIAHSLRHTLTVRVVSSDAATMRPHELGAKGDR